TNLATDLKGLWDAATASMEVIRRYAEADGVDPNADAPALEVDFFVYDRPVYTYNNNTYDFDPEFYVRVDNIETGKAVTLNFNDGTNDVSVTKSYTGDGSDSSKSDFIISMLNSAELSGIKSDALLGWSSYTASPLYSTYTYDNGITNGQYNTEPRNIGGVENGKWMRIELNIDDSSFNNINSNTYDVSHWSGTISEPISDPFITPTVDDFKNIGVVEYAKQNTVHETLTVANGSLILDGTVEQKIYHFDDYNLIEKFRSATDDPDQESYYLLDLTRDGTIGSADADIKTNVSFAVSSGSNDYYLNTWVANVNEVKQLIANNADLQIEGVYYDVGLSTWNDEIAASGPIVVSWQNGQLVDRVVTNDTPRVYIVQPNNHPENYANSVTTSGPSYTAGRGDVHIFDVSDASFDGVTFSITDANGDQSSLLALTGTPGQSGSYLAVSIPSDQSVGLSLTTSAGGTFALSIVDGETTPIDTSNINSINELFAVASVGADNG
ncbi:hypothetical protein, partial [Roseobacter sp. HKCCA2468]|uniref:hypothetical protein n=1 Tax=Roseobacter sp. HKCCA2468 TaxID=3120342 RepID=UPI0030EC459A